MIQKVIKSLAVICVVLLARLVPIHWIIGSHAAAFSLSSIFAPVVGLHCGLAWITMFVWTKKVTSLSSLGYSCLHRLPLFFAAQSLRQKGYLVSAIVPLLCMGLFVLHPVGGQAWLYSLYWLIPITLSCVATTEMSRALQASFTAHAVGSVIWLYTGAIPASMWIALIPVVAYERLFIAVGIYVVNKFCVTMIQSMKQYVTSFKACA